jgi:hypothetical protein
MEVDIEVEGAAVTLNEIRDNRYLGAGIPNVVKLRSTLKCRLIVSFMKVNIRSESRLFINENAN